MKRWYNWFRSSRLYGLFLRHRAWKWEILLNKPILGYVAEIGYFVAWFCIPMIAVLYLANALIIMLSMQAALAIGLTFTGFIVIYAPILWTIFSDYIYRSFARLSEKAKECRDLATHDYNTWIEENG